MVGVMKSSVILRDLYFFILHFFFEYRKRVISDRPVAECTCSPHHARLVDE